MVATATSSRDGTTLRAVADRHGRLARVLSVVLVLLVAALLRFDRLSSFPPGLFHDVAYNGLDVLDILHGKLSIFFTANNGREPLFIYLQAATVALFGTTAFGLRIASALTGVLTVAVVYAWCRAWFGYRTAVAAAATLSTLLWHVYLSRIGLRVILLPLMTTLTLFVAWRALSRRSSASAFGAGVVGGVAMYTHIASRLLPPLALLVAGIEILADRSFLRRGFGRLAIIAACWLAVAAPLYVYFVVHRDIFLSHTGEVSWISATYDEQNHRLDGPADRWAHGFDAAKKVVGMFLFAGDQQARHNVPGMPVFGPVLGTLWIVGMVRCLTGFRSTWISRSDQALHVYAWLLVWWLVMAFSSAFSEQAPHFHRTAGSLPPTVAFVGLGADWLWRAAAQARQRSTYLPLLIAVGALVFVWTGATTYRTVWTVLAPSPWVRSEWESSLRDVGDSLAASIATSPHAPVYVQVGADSEFMRVTTQFLASRATRWRFVPADQTMAPIPDNRGDGMLVAGDARLPLVAALVQAMPETGVEHVFPGANDIPSYQLLSIRGEQLASALRPVGPICATFDGQVALLGYRLLPAGADASSVTISGGITVVFQWKFTPSARGGYDLFVQLLDPGGKLIAQEDRGAPSSALAVGETGLTVHHLRVQATPPSGPYRVIVGVATPDGARRLSPSGTTLPVISNAILIDTIGSAN